MEKYREQVIENYQQAICWVLWFHRTRAG